MSKIKLTGSNSGYVEIDSAADAGNLTLQLPTSGTRLLSDAGNVFTGITTTGELDVNGSIDVSSTSVFNNDLTLKGGSYDVLWDSSDNALEFGTNAKATFGDAMQLYHDGSNSLIQDSGTGHVQIRSGTFTVGNAGLTKTSAIFNSGSGQQLNFNNNQKFITTNTGVVVTGICTASSFSGSGEALTRTTQLSHRNIIINGAMLVAQRGTSSTSAGYQTVDRISQGFANVNENPTCGQGDVGAPSSPYNLPTSGDHPYKEGFRKTYYVGNGNQTTVAGANQDMSFFYKIEGQDLVGSGWNFADPNSYLTISFWIKASISQTYYVGFRLYGPSNGNQREYCFNFTPAAPFEWTKVTHSIPGHASNTLREDNEMGAFIQFVQYWGTNYTSSGRVNEAWQAKNNNSNYPDMSGNYYNQNDASYQITGLQLEVGQQSTPFEHRSFGEELARCQRYFYRVSTTASGTGQYKHIGTMQYYGGSHPYGKMLDLPVPMRTIPTGSHIGDIRPWTAGGSPNGSFTSINYDRNDNKFLGSNGSTTNQNSGSNGDATPITLWTSSSMSADAEL